MKTFVHAILIASLFVGCCSAQTPTLRVIPCNNHEAALSLTFDDSRSVHLDVVIPEVNKRLHATFFLIVSKTDAKRFLDSNFKSDIITLLAPTPHERNEHE